MSVSTDLLAYGLIVVLAPALLYRLRWIFSLDHDDEPRQGAVVIPIRTFGRVCELVFAVGGAASIVAGVLDLMDGSDKGIWGIPFGFAISLFASYMTNTHLWLDEVGLYYRSGLGKPRVIEWRDLDHYEQTVSYGVRVATRYFLFCLRDGATFWISKNNYDVNKLLDLIDAHVAIDEKPYAPQ